MVVILVSLLPVLAQPAFSAPQGTRAEVDAFMAERMERLKMPGAAVGVVQGDQVIHLQGYGSAGGGRGVTPQTPFLLASISKSFTALAVMQLVEAGELELDTPVQQVLPWFQVQGAGAAAITVRHLLYQTSGFSENLGYERNLEPDAADALEASIRRLAGQSLVRAPGEAFEYSNTNYDLLGLIVETISGQTYEQYIQDEIFAPLAMANAHTSLAQARANGMSSGHYPFFGFSVVSDRWMPYTRAVLPSAGLIASAEDMSHYLVMHLNGGQFDGKQVLSAEGVTLLHTPGVEIGPGIGYGMGWVRFTWDEAAAAGEAAPSALSHSGNWQGFITNMVLVPERKLGVFVLLNGNDPQRESAYFNIGFDLARLALGLEPANAAPGEDFLRQNGRALGLAAIALLVFGNLLLARQDGGQKRRLMLGIAFALDLIVAGYVIFLIFDSQSSLPMLVRSTPDWALVYLGLLLLTLGLGSRRTWRGLRY
jgi:CubicO group peptidase (beta-lactamase class C family)